ncbi:hypothetical protein CPB86DRAFT_782455 [Serendipita vermifera]|nr:hypothetical protein CPB86DRAFT_782455 [Serendipita vermifera]
MTQHLREEYKIYPFKCTTPKCKFSSTRPADLKQHVIEQHTNTNPYVCEYCGDVLRHKRNYQRHLRETCSELHKGRKKYYISGSESGHSSPVE